MSLLALLTRTESPGSPTPDPEDVYTQTIRQVSDKCRPVIGWYSRDAEWTSATCRRLHTIHADAPGTRLWFNNMDNKNPLGKNPYRVRVGIEFMDGTTQTLTFDGQATGTVNPGQIIGTDPVGLPAGQVFIRTYTEVDPGQSLPTTNGPNNETSKGEALALNQDLHAGTGPFANQHSPTMGPCAVTAQGVGVAVAVVGDSVSVGAGDGGDANGAPALGAFGRGLTAANIPHVHWGLGGSRSSEFTDAFLDAIALPDPGVTHVLVEHGLNTSSNGEAGQKKAEVDLWYRLAAQLPAGVRLYQATINPYTKSTDGWTTVSGQTELYPGVQGAYNEWIRDGAPIKDGKWAAVGDATATRAGQAGHPLTGWLEVGGAVESTIGSNIWAAPDGTPLAGDGLHPNAAGATLMAGKVRDWALALTAGG